MKDPAPLVERIARLCQKRSPEALDKIFDTMHVGLTQPEAENLSMQVTQSTAAALRSDPNTLAWWCGYMASEINCSADNDRQDLSTTALARTLIDAGLLPFQDFVPYPGRRLILLDSEIFATLPSSVQQAMQDLFDVDEKTAVEVERINEAIRQELVVMEERSQ